MKHRILYLLALPMIACGGGANTNDTGNQIDADDQDVIQDLDVNDIAGETGPRDASDDTGDDGGDLDTGDATDLGFADTEDATLGDADAANLDAGDGGHDDTADTDVTPPPAPAIISFSASPQWAFSTLAGTTLTPVFENGTGVIQPGDIAVQSGQEIPVKPAAATRYILTVTGVQDQTVSASLAVYPTQTWALGNHFTVFVAPDTTAYATGSNIHSALGDGTSTSSFVPVPITGLGSGVVQVSGGSSGAAALKADGTVWAWA